MKNHTGLDGFAYPNRLMAAAAPSEGGDAAAGTGAGGDAPNGSGDINPWQAMVGSLPEEIRESIPDLKTTKDFASFAQQYREQGKMIGKNRIPVLDKNASPAEIKEALTKLGWPESADKYDLSDFSPPEGVPWDQNSVAPLLEVLHSAGLNNEQASRIVKGYAEQQKNYFESVKGQVKESYDSMIADLKGEWGKDFDANLSLAGRAWRELAGDLDSDENPAFLADGSRLGSHPAVVRMAGELGKIMAEHGRLGEAAGSTTGGSAGRDAVQSQIDAKMADPDFSKRLMDGDKSAVEEINILFKRLEAAGYDPTPGL